MSATPPAKRRFGQHFLEPAWVAKVVRAVGPAPDHRIIEIGAGRGALTVALASRVQRLVAVEVDGDLVDHLRATGVTNVQTVQADFLELDLAALVDGLRTPTPGLLRVVGNLPYNVSVPIVIRLLQEARRVGIHDGVLMLQREVANRVLATVGTRDYGPLAVLTHLFASATAVLDVPPGAFRPVPQVRSTVIRLHFREAPRRPRHHERFDALVRRLFTQRRKQVVNALAPIMPPGALPPSEVCRRAGVLPTRRPGELTVSELIDLSEVLAGGPGRS